MASGLVFADPDHVTANSIIYLVQISPAERGRNALGDGVVPPCATDNPNCAQRGNRFPVWLALGKRVCFFAQKHFLLNKLSSSPNKNDFFSRILVQNSDHHQTVFIETTPYLHVPTHGTFFGGQNEFCFRTNKTNLFINKSFVSTT